MKKIFIILYLSLLSFSTWPAVGELSQSFTLEGQLYDQPTGTAPFLGTAEIGVRILSHDKLCVLYAEKHSVDTTSSEGVFNIKVGSGTRVAGIDSNNSMAGVFQNLATINATGASCPGVTTYTPTVGREERYAQILVTPTSTGITDTLSPDIFLGSIPSALVSQSLQGYVPSSFLKVGTVAPLTQLNVEDVFSVTNFPILQSIIAAGGNSTSSATNATINADNDGNSSGTILFQINGSTKAEVKNDGDFSVGTNSFYVDSGTSKVGIGNTAPSYDLSFGGVSNRVLGIERNTAPAAGSSMTVSSGGAIASGTNLDGGDLILSSGIATGLGASNIYLNTSNPSVSGNSDNSPSTKVAVLGNGNVGIGVISPTAILDVTSTTSGIRIPRMTTAQRDAIASPSAMQIYNTTTNKLNFHNGTSWQELGIVGGSVTSIVAGTGLTGGTITTTGTLAVDVGVTAGKIVQLDGSAKLPAVDGSLVTNITAANLGGAVPILKGGTGLSAVGAANTILGTNSLGTLLEYKVPSAVAPLSISNAANSISFDLGTVPVIKGGTGLAAGGASNTFLATNSAGSAMEYKAAAATPPLSITHSANLMTLDLGTVQVANGGTGITSLTGDRLYTSNTLGTAFQSFTCSLTEVLSFNVLGAPICTSLSSIGSIVSGGNTLTADMSIGTNDAFALNLETNNSPRMTILSSGNIGVGTTAPATILDINGAQTQRAMSAPSVAPAGQGRIYFDSTSNTYKVSQNGGAYSDLSGFSALTAASATNTIDNLNFAQIWNWSTATTQSPMSMNANALTTGSILSLSTSNASVNSTSGLLSVANTGASTSGTIMRVQSNSTAGSGMTVLASGNVGIGTASPTTALDINGAQTQRGMSAPSVAPAGQGRIYFDSTSNTYKVSQNGGAYSDLSGLSAFTAASATNTIDNLNFAQSWNWSTATTQSPMSINANALTTGSILDLSTSNATLNSTNGLLRVANTGASTSGTIMRVQSNSTAGSGLTVLANGNVGIGTSTIPQPLTVNGNALFGTNVSTLTATPINVSFGGTYGSNTAGSQANLKWDMYNASGSNRYGIGMSTGLMEFQAGSNNDGNFAWWTGSATERMRLTTAGNLGIGTASPATALDINGAQTQRGMSAPSVAPAGQGRIYFDSTSNTYKVSQNGGAYSDISGFSALTAASATNTIDNLNFAQIWNWSTATTQSPMSMNANALTTGSILSLSTSNASVNSTSGLLSVANTSASTTGTIMRIQSNSTAGSGLTVLANGNVGIGTSTISRPLTVAGNGMFGTTASVASATPLNVSFGGTYGSNTPGSSGNLKWKMYDDGTAANDYGIGMSAGLMELRAGNAAALGFFTNNGTAVMRMTSAGNVGIGTTAPSMKFVLGDTTANTYNIGLGSAGSVSQYKGLAFTDTTGGTIYSALQLYNDASNDSSLRFRTWAGTAGGTEAMVIKGVSGNVGIGLGNLANPSTKLDVNGQIKGGYLSHSSLNTDWASGNIQTTSAAAGTITFTSGSMFNGASYTLILTSTGTFTLSTAGDVTTWRCLPVCSSNQIVATGHTVLTIVKAGTTGYVSWMAGF